MHTRRFRYGWLAYVIANDLVALMILSRLCSLGQNKHSNQGESQEIKQRAAHCDDARHFATTITRRHIIVHFDTIYERRATFAGL